MIRRSPGGREAVSARCVLPYVSAPISGRGLPKSSCCRKERVKTYSKAIANVMTHAQKAQWYARRWFFTLSADMSPTVAKKSTMFEMGPANAMADAAGPSPAAKRAE